MNDKKLQKIEKLLGLDTINELNANSSEALKNSVIVAEQAINQAVNELEANPAFQELKENLKALSQGLREVKARQNAIIQYCLHRLEDKE